MHPTPILAAFSNTSGRPKDALNETKAHPYVNSYVSKIINYNFDCH